MSWYIVLIIASCGAVCVVFGFKNACNTTTNVVVDTNEQNC